MLSDWLTAMTILPWLIPLGFFVFIFLEWSGRDRREDNVHARLFGSQKDALNKLVDGEQ
jgi:hypothetical protein